MVFLAIEQFSIDTEVVMIIILLIPTLYIVTVASGGILCALLASSFGFFSAFFEHINPYSTYVDKHTNATNLRRGYFFGPGYHQIVVTASSAFSKMRTLIETITQKEESDRGFLVSVFFGSAILFAYVFGSIFVCIYSFIMSLVILTGMCVFFLLFSVPWTADRLFLILRSITVRCPNCKRLSVIPAFVCPKCGAEHTGLTPGPYGTFHRKCSCGQRLPTTVFNGRLKLKCVCPYCRAPLAHSGAKQFGIQLVGSMSVGKTTYLTAFWHLFLDKTRKNPDVSIKLFPKDAFDELEHWYQNGYTEATNDKNAKMYSVILTRRGKTPFQFTLYDVAGESFSELDAHEQQQQFRYCEAIIVALDPEDPQGSERCISGFVQEFGKLRKKRTTKLSDIPVAVVISKGDLYKREIGLPKIRIQANAILATNGTDCSPSSVAVIDDELALFMARTDLCQRFLRRHGFENTINLLEGTFNNIAFFPVSALGHAVEMGQTFDPWGVLEPMRWIVRQTGEDTLYLGTLWENCK